MASDIAPTAIPPDVTPGPVVLYVEPVQDAHDAVVHRGGSIPAFVSFNAMSEYLEAAEVELRKALRHPLHVRFENGYSVALVDVEDIEVLVQGQRVIHLTAEDREEASAS